MRARAQATAALCLVVAAVHALGVCPASTQPTHARPPAALAAANRGREPPTLVETVACATVPSNNGSRSLHARSAPLRADMQQLPQGCPDRYLAALDDCTFGRLGNNIFTFKGLLELGLRTNRTVLLPPSAPGYASLAFALDLPRLQQQTGWCFVVREADAAAADVDSAALPPAPGIFELVAAERAAARTSRIVHLGMLRPDVKRTPSNSHTTAYVDEEAEAEAKAEQALGAVDCAVCPERVVQHVLLNPERPHLRARVVEMECGALYRLGTGHKTYPYNPARKDNMSVADQKAMLHFSGLRSFDLAFFRAIRLHPEIELQAKVFAHAHLDERYIAYHLRHFEGHESLLQPVGALDMEALFRLYKIATGLSLHAIQAEARAQTQRGAVFVASDGQMPHREQAFRQAGAVFAPPSTVHRSPEHARTYAVCLDLALLMQARVLVGQGRSSLITFAARLREANGVEPGLTFVKLPPGF